MSLPHESPNVTNEQLARYLLGLLPDDEAERLDEASIATDEIAERLRIVEADLIDAYVRGTLTGEMLERFESRYLASPRRREEVRFARSFLRAVDRAAPPDAPAVAPDASPVPAREPARVPAPGPSAEDGAAIRSKLALRLLAAAALLLIACGALLFETVRLRSGLSVAQKAAVASDLRARELEQQLSGQRAANATVARELERARESAAALAFRTAQESLTVALVLQPQTRALGPVPTLAIPSGADRVAFELRLESNEFSRYQVALKDPASNQTVWRSPAITATASGQTPSVSVIVPSRVLKAQHYSLAVTAQSAGHTEVVGSYTFQVAQR